MPQPFLIIDAYNLMHACGLARSRYGPGDLERLRNRFLNWLSGRLTPAERQRTTVVFDAHDAPTGLENAEKREEMTVLYAPPGGDADSLIEELVAAHSAPRQVRVVSSDRRLRRAARRRRGSSVSSEAFARQLEHRDGGSDERTPDADQRAKMTGASGEDDVAHWLSEFGPIPEAAELGGEEQSLEDLHRRVERELEDDPRID